MVNRKQSTRQHLSRGIEMLYEDEALLAVDKPAGLLTVSTPTEKVKTAQAVLTEYIRKGSAKSRKQIFTVHRLDQWKDTEKTYVTVVYGHLSPKEGVISSYLAENARFVVYSTTDAKKGKLAQTGYKVVMENDQFSLLEIALLTGRKNQIRVQMADKGHPVVGDRKYGKEKDSYRRLALHSKSVRFSHPVSGEPVAVEAPVPAYFKELMAGKSSTLRHG
jgi:tRNA pseudouridine32 synthase/23S rRNA pseudouridine746 synthase/23S rRNA pseudouridine1911/1915/1917 synthase